MDIQPMEKRLFNPQQIGDEFGRDRSESLESSDSWMERRPVSQNFDFITKILFSFSLHLAIKLLLYLFNEVTHVFP